MQRINRQLTVQKHEIEKSEYRRNYRQWSGPNDVEICGKSIWLFGIVFYYYEEEELTVL